MERKRQDHDRLLQRLPIASTTCRPLGCCYSLAPPRVPTTCCASCLRHLCRSTRCSRRPASALPSSRSGSRRRTCALSAVALLTGQPYAPALLPRPLPSALEKPRAVQGPPAAPPAASPPPHGELDPLGDRRSACATSGVLATRALPLEHAVARVCREAGARVARRWRT